MSGIMFACEVHLNSWLFLKYFKKTENNDWMPSKLQANEHLTIDDMESANQKIKMWRNLGEDLYCMQLTLMKTGLTLEDMLLSMVQQLHPSISPILCARGICKTLQKRVFA